MSATAFATIMKYAKEHDLSEISGRRRTLREARDLSLPETPFGPTIVSTPLVGAGASADYTLHLINPMSFLYLAYKQGGGFHTALNHALANNPCSHDNPWRLVIYSDEVVPGNVLSTHNNRKVWCMYWSLLELHHHLSDELAWFPIVTEPTMRVKKVAAGISQLFAKVIKFFFGSGDGSHDFRAGIKLVGPDGNSVRLFLVLSMVLQDGAAQKLVWSCKGDAGTRPCMLCLDLVAPSSNLPHASNRLASDLLKSDLLLATNADIRHSLARLKAFKLTETVGDFKLRQQAHGFTLQEHCLLCDESLEDIVYPVDQYCHDWMHGLLASGVFNVICFLVLAHLASLRTNNWSVLRDYVMKWHWPRSKRVSPENSDWFEDIKVKTYTKAKQFKCSASEALSLLPVLCFYVQAVGMRIPGVNIFICNALLLLGDLVDLLLVVPHGLVTPSQLAATIRQLLQACKDAGWSEDVIPKFHWLVHFPLHLERWGLLPSCFVNERKHKVAIRYGTDMDNTRAYAKSLVSEVASHQLSDLNEPGAFDLSARLLRPTKAAKALANVVRNALQLPAAVPVYISTRANTHALAEITKGDMVLIMSPDSSQYSVGCLWLCVSAEGRGLFCFVSPGTLVAENHALGEALWRLTDDAPCVTALSDVFVSLLWCEASADVVRTIIPYEYRGFRAVSG